MIMRQRDEILMRVTVSNHNLQSMIPVTHGTKSS